MEEILASIRRIIAEDGEQAPAVEKPAAEPQPQPPDPTTAARDEEVLELTEIVEERPKTAAPAQNEWMPPEPSAEPAPDSGNRLVSDAAAAASLAALSQINQLGGRKEQTMSDIPLGSGQRTIEELVRDMLRPMLKEWLDSNLPSLVERVVQDEVDRLVRDVRRR